MSSCSMTKTALSLAVLPHGLAGSLGPRLRIRIPLQKKPRTNQPPNSRSDNHPGSGTSSTSIAADAWHGQSSLSPKPDDTLKAYVQHGHLGGLETSTPSIHFAPVFRPFGTWQGELIRGGRAARCCMVASAASGAMLSATCGWEPSKLGAWFRRSQNRTSKPSKDTRPKVLRAWNGYPRQTKQPQHVAANSQCE